MAPPPIALFMTTIASQPALRQRQEYILRTLQVKKIPYITYDLASDEDAKRLWRRKAPADKQQLPGILVGGKFPGTFAEFEDAVEHDDLDIFLRRDEAWEPLFEDRPMPVVKPVGVPGAMTPLEMTPERLKKKILAGIPASSPLKGKKIPVNKRIDEIDIGDDLGEHGLQGVKVSRDELRALVEELGLAGDDAGDLVRGLTSLSISGKVAARNPERQGEENTGPSEGASADIESAVEQLSVPDKAKATGDKIGETSEKVTSSNADCKNK